MKKYLIALLLLPYVCIAQKKTIRLERPYIVKLNLTSLTDGLTFPTLQLSVEKKVTNNISISAETGLQLYELSTIRNDTFFIKPQGYKGSVEVRYYPLLNAKHLARKPYKIRRVQPYGGINLGYRQNKFNSSLDYTKPANDLVYHDCLWGVKKVSAINLVVGVEGRLSNRLVFDGYIRMGAINRQVTNYNREYNELTDEAEKSMDVTFRSSKSASNLSENGGWMENLNLGIRLGIALGALPKK